MSPLPTMPERTTDCVLGVQVDAVDWETAVERLLSWGRVRQSRYVALCNVHVLVTATRDDGYRRVIENADLGIPDGAPVAWMLRRLGFCKQVRISGPDLMWGVCARCAEEGLSVYFYGSTEATLAALGERLRGALPELAVAGMESPPFRALSAEEDAAAVARINNSEAAIVFVGLGCPKQERWMAEHVGIVNAVMIGVGAAFDFHAGTLKRAPGWMRAHGLEWLHRLMTEPRRLWRRYLLTNTLFVIGAARQLLKA